MALSAPPARAGVVTHLAVAGLGPLRVEIDGRPVPFRAAVASAGSSSTCSSTAAGPCPGRS